MPRPQTYIGLDKDMYGGMTTIGKIIRDARVFGLLNDSETCAGWNGQRIEVLMDKVNAEWDKYGCMVSNLPADLSERHQAIHGQAICDAKEAGWTGEIETGDDR